MKNMLTLIKNEAFLFVIFTIFFLDHPTFGRYSALLFPIYIFLNLKIFIRNVDIKGIFLLLFSLFYVAFYSLKSNYSLNLIPTYLSFFVVYMIGKILSKKYQSDNFFYFLFIFLMLIEMLIPTISILMNIITNGFKGGRNMSLIWDKNLEIPATGLAGHFILSIVSLSTLLVPNTTKFFNKMKIFYGAVFFISIICIFRLASKTQIGILTITMVTAIIYLFRKQSLLKNISIVLFISILILTVSYLKTTNSSLFEIYNQRAENEDISYTMSASGRTELWSKSIGYIFNHPLGWNSQELGYGYAHNLWLDTARVAGILPLIFLLIFTFLSISQIPNILKSKNYFFNINILSTFIGLLALFFVEPIIEGLPSSFIIFCLLTGYLAGFKEIRTVPLIYKYPEISSKLAPNDIVAKH